VAHGGVMAGRQCRENKKEKALKRKPSWYLSGDVTASARWRATKENGGLRGSVK